MGLIYNLQVLIKAIDQIDFSVTTEDVMLHKRSAFKLISTVPGVSYFKKFIETFIELRKSISNKFTDKIAGKNENSQVFLCNRSHSNVPQIIA